MKKFTTEKLESRMEMSKWIGFGLIIIGIILLSVKDVSGTSKFESIGGLIDGIIMPLIGIFLFVTSYQRLKKLKGSFVSFKENGVSFKSRLVEYQNESLEDLNSIKIFLKTVEIGTKEGKSITFYLEDYSDFKSKKLIKEEFTRIQGLKNNA